jgi:hypothetical protein
MNIYRWLAGSALTLPLAIGMQLANAQNAPKVDPDKLPKVACSDLTFNHDFLSKYPKAPAACQEARVYKGKRYAKFNGKVAKKDEASMSVQVLNVSGDPLDTVSFKPSTAAKVILNGEPAKLTDLKVGDPLTFWIAESRFAFYTSPGKGASPGLPPQ